MSKLNMVDNKATFIMLEVKHYLNKGYVMTDSVDDADIDGVDIYSRQGGEYFDSMADEYSHTDFAYTATDKNGIELLNFDIIEYNNGDIVIQNADNKEYSLEIIKENN